MRSGWRPFARLWRDEGGAVLVLVTFTMPILFGIGAIVVDLGRVAAQQTELQSVADRMALAAAVELDGTSGAIDRARSAVTTFIGDEVHTFGEGDGTLSVDGDHVTLRFLRDLPADDSTALDASYETSSDEAARFVEVTVAPGEVAHWLAGTASAALTAIGAEADLPAGSEVASSAVAGSKTWYCDITPLMFCSPYADKGRLRANLTPGRMISLKNGNTWGPGNFGLLDIVGDASGPCGSPNQGANYWRCVVGLVGGATGCVDGEGTVDLRPGNVAGPVESGLNTRFDLYQTSLKKESDNPLYAPAPNVVKGTSGGGGGNGNNGNGNGNNGNNGNGNGNNGNNGNGNGNNAGGSSTDTIALPRDDCFANGSCPDPRFGDGVWDRDLYVDTNHDGVAPPNAGTTRYEMYLAEIAAANGGDILQGKAETGRPETSPYMVDDPSRRVLTAAAVDCDSQNVKGNASGIEVLDYFNLFLTEPAGSPKNGDIWVEVIGPADIGDGTSAGSVKDVVQLYR